MTDHGGDAPSVRLDKWLWAARFFKTRQQAVEAINGGTVKVEGRRAKPGRSVAAGTRIEVHKGPLTWEVEVLDPSRQRRSATEAALLYREDEASRLRRQDKVRERRDRATDTSGRPTKKDRRMIQRFTSVTETEG